MLTFALKQTSAVQLAKVATTYLGKNYDKNVVQRVTPIVTEMDNLRTRVVAISAAKSAEEASLEVLAIYHRHVVAMESRLPLGPKSVNIKLSWTDTLSRNKISEQSWALEKLCIMFNMAAVYSQVGGQIPRNSPENKKKAIQCFKSAAGCLDIVRNLSRELKGVQNIVDLRADALQMRISICMAQAYLSFYETMDKQTTSKSILARVAITINRYYSQAYEAAQQREILRMVGQEWVDILGLCTELYRARSHYWLSFLDKEEAVKAGAGFGKVVTRLKVALRFAQKAGQFRRAKVEYLNEAREAIQEIEKACKEAESDNMSIYMEGMVAESTLNDPEQITQIKLEPPPINTTDPLSNQQELQLLIPPPVLQMVTEYKELVNGIIASMHEASAATRKTVSDALAQMNLPQKLDALSSDQTGLPQGTWQKIQDVQSKGGVPQIEQMMISLTNFAEHSKKMISEQESMLTAEETDDAFMRQQYSGRWNRSESSGVNVGLKQELFHYKNKIDQAQNSDQIIAQNFNGSTDKLDLLKKSKSELDSLMPAGMNTEEMSQQPAVLTLATALTSLREQERVVDENINNLIAENNGDNVVGELMDVYTSRGSKEQCFNHELAKYAPHQEKIQADLATLQSNLQDVINANRGFDGIYQTLQTNPERVSYLENLEQACVVFNETMNNCHQGISFYQQLNNHLTVMHQKISDFIYSRNLEKSQLLAQLGPGAAPQASAPQSNPYGYPPQQPGQYPPQQPGQYPPQQPGQYPPQQGQYPPGQGQYPGQPPYYR